MLSIRSCFPSRVSVFGRGFPDYSVKRLTQQQQKRLIANCGRHCIFSSFLISSLSLTPIWTRRAFPLSQESPIRAWAPPPPPWTLGTATLLTDPLPLRAIRTKRRHRSNSGADYSARSHSDAGNYYHGYGRSCPTPMKFSCSIFN